MTTLPSKNDTTFLSPSKFCDSESKIIGQAAKNISHNSTSQIETARRIFYWVRDNIKWELGLTPDTASDTLLRGAGSCTNKANLAVALWRYLGIPAGYHVMEVKARRYLGVLCTETFGQFMKETSLHTYCSILLDGKWIKVDPTDDVRLSNSVQHLVFQARKVEFDGSNDARLHLDPEHVIHDPPVPLASVDEVLGKKRRLDTVAGEVMNMYLDFMRDQCIWHDSVETMEVSFFAQLRETQPVIWERFHSLCSQLKKSREEIKWNYGTPAHPDLRA